MHTQCHIAVKELHANYLTAAKSDCTYTPIILLYKVKQDLRRRKKKIYNEIAGDSNAQFCALASEMVASVVEWQVVQHKTALSRY